MTTPCPPFQNVAIALPLLCHFVSIPLISTQIFHVLLFNLQSPFCAHLTFLLRQGIGHKALRF
jgi:hypothetical protein